MFLKKGLKNSTFDAESIYSIINSNIQTFTLVVEFDFALPCLDSYSSHAQFNSVYFSTMGRKCCVPGCRSGYVGKAAKPDPIPSTSQGGPEEDPDPGGSLSFHSFPKDDNLKRKWIQTIPRDD
jgi:hypothetical protein